MVILIQTERVVASSLPQGTGKNSCSADEKLVSSEYKLRGVDLFAVGKFLTHATRQCVGVRPLLCVFSTSHVALGYIQDLTTHPHLPAAILAKPPSWERLLPTLFAYLYLPPQAVLSAAARVVLLRQQSLHYPEPSTSSPVSAQ